MYKILHKNLVGFEEYFENDERLVMAKPLFLLKSITIFNFHKLQNTAEYNNLLVVIDKVKGLKEENKYHSFGILLTELELLCYDFASIDKRDESSVVPEVLEYQINLLHQFTFPAYYN